MPATTNWRFELDVENIGWLTIDTPNAPVNTLSRLALTELDAVIARAEELVATRELVGLVFQSGKESGFIAGAFFIMTGAATEPAGFPAGWPCPACSSWHSESKRQQHSS